MVSNTTALVLENIILVNILLGPTTIGLYAGLAGSPLLGRVIQPSNLVVT